jgi:hypothetical protein
MSAVKKPDKEDERTLVFVGSEYALLTGVVLGMVVVTIIWLAVSWLGSPPSPEGGETQALAQSQAERQSRTPSVLGRELVSSPKNPCQERFDAQTRAVDAADATLSQWEVHVGAMNKLVTGAITLQQAKAFWNRTRVGAGTRLARYDAAVSRLEGRGAACLRMSAGLEAGQAECASAVHARDRLLGRADRAVETWRMHVHHMEMLRDGTLSATQATQMWLRSWHRGVRQLDAYHAVDAAAESRHCMR